MASGPNRRPHEDEIDVFGMTHPGLVRAENQDHFLLATIRKRVLPIATNLPREAQQGLGDERLAFLAMVADGVGGGKGGAAASATALEAATRYIHTSVACLHAAAAEETDITAELQRAAQAAHDAVVARRDAAGIEGSMATTLTVYLGAWPATYLLQVGDSRHYLYHEGTLRQVTRDQTMAQELLARGALTEAQAQASPYAHVLSSAIGADKTAPVVTRLEAEWGHIHLLCSDGLTKHVTDARIAEILGTMTSARQACETLVQEALDGGGTDNVTVIVGRAVPKGP